ncbi:MAG: SH3 domain-containing protein [Amphritea sp.]|nr:SH3 domain-containing protein [Amphritea sp.]
MKVKLKAGILKSVLTGVLTMTSMAVSAFEYYVVNQDTTVFESPGSSQSMTDLYKGQMLLKIDQKGNWSRVFFLSADKQPLKGWLPAGMITPQGAPAGVDLASDNSLIVNVDTLRIRKGPGSKHAVVGALKREQMVKPLAVEGEWVQVQYLDAKGATQVVWTARRYLKPVTVTAKPADSSDVSASVSAVKDARYQVIGDNVRVRKGPGTNYKIAGKLSKNQQVEVLSSKGSWKQIRVSNGENLLVGWTTERFLKPLN